MVNLKYFIFAAIQLCSNFFLTSIWDYFSARTDFTKQLDRNTAAEILKIKLEWFKERWTDLWADMDPIPRMMIHRYQPRPQMEAAPLNQMVNALLSERLYSNVQDRCHFSWKHKIRDIFTSCTKSLVLQEEFFKQLTTNLWLFLYLSLVLRWIWFIQKQF